MASKTKLTKSDYIKLTTDEDIELLDEYNQTDYQFDYDDTRKASLERKPISYTQKIIIFLEKKNDDFCFVPASSR